MEIQEPRIKRKSYRKYNRKDLRHRRSSQRINIQLTGVPERKTEKMKEKKYIYKILAELMHTNFQNKKAQVSRQWLKKDAT